MATPREWPRHNLPAQVTRLIGRDQEVRQIAKLLSGSRSVTLTGAGGVGKTRLALHVATEVVERFDAGVWLVELASLADPALVPRAVAAALHRPDPMYEAAEDGLLHYLSRHQVLLVLDNCEHLVAACATLVERILRACPGVRVLSTSRERLRHAGETAVSVQPLSVPPSGGRVGLDEITGSASVRLFVDRARACHPAFSVTSENATAVAEVCRRLDGMPLAIELAAARLSVLSPRQIAERLADDAFSLLVVGARTAVSRQQTLRSMVDWSHALLSEHERVLFRRLAVFAGGFTVEAAESVCSDETIPRGDVLDLLGRLVETALVTVDRTGSGDVRQRLLETLRQYSSERLLASGEEQHIRDRHVQWYLELAEAAEPELRAAQQREWFQRLETEHDNIRAAVQWSVTNGDAIAGLRLGSALWEFWDLRGHAREGWQHMQRLLERTTDLADDVTRAKALWAAGSLAQTLGLDEPARAVLEASLSLSRVLGNRWHTGRALVRLGGLAFNRGELELAERLHTENLAIRRELDHRRGIAVALANLGSVAVRLGDLDRATSLLDEGLHMFAQDRDTQGMAPTTLGLGEIAYLRDDLARAGALMREALGLAHSVRTVGQVSLCLEALALVAVRERRLARATRLLGASAEMRIEIGEPLPAYERSVVEGMLAASRAGLGDAAFAAAWRAGQAASFDEIVDFALGEPGLPGRPGPDDLGTRLSSRECEVARLIATGLTNRHIADHLVVSERTVDAHCRHIFDKLGVSSRAQVAAWAVASGLVAR
jgi:predicted ATPase/DNA-binding CsgD family transcriptional regulator